MGHVERCAERILFLSGDVEMVAAGTVQKIHDVKSMLEQARKMEEESVRDYNQWANECSTNADAGTKKGFEALVDDEERHFSQYDLEMEKLKKFGEQFLALQSMEGSKATTGTTEA
jgi:bacterioferritin